jgi:hypothetical protein
MVVMRILALFVFCSAALVGCGTPHAVSSASAQPSGLARLLRVTPLSVQLASYDRAIDALRDTEARWSARARAAEIARNRNETNVAFADASTALQQIRMRVPSYRGRERTALSELLDLSRAPSPAQEAARGEQRAVTQIEDGFTRRVDDALSERREQLQEDESTLALQLTRRDADRILALRVRTQDLGLDRERYRRARSQLDAIYRRESATLAAEAARNANALAAYRAELLREVAPEERRAIAALRQRIAANLVQGSPGDAATEALRGDIGALDSSSPSQAQISATLGTFRGAQSALDARFAALAATDAAAVRRVQEEIARLQRERAALQTAMTAWIRRCGRQRVPPPQLECATLRGLH